MAAMNCGLAARAGSLSPAMASSTAGSAVERAMVRRWSPASTGESTSVARLAGAKSMSPPEVRVTVRAVPNFQPVGSRSDACTAMSSFAPGGASSTQCQDSTMRWSVVDGPALNLPSLGARYSSATSTRRAPSGTSRWKAYMSTGSRRQGRVRPAAVNSRPARLTIGPVGPCSPGIHFG